MIFDTHAHYDDEAFDGERDMLFHVMEKEGVKYIINPGCSVESSQRAYELSQRYDSLFFAVGVHPEELNGNPETYIQELLRLLNNDKCVAIGEIGLDYYWDSSNKEIQKKLFEEQMQLALSVNKPVIIHDREAHQDSMEIIKKYPDVKGVFHCFSGSAEMAEALLERGWYLGFDGPVTYKNARKTIDVLKVAPIERILIETDSPYLSPVPKRGTRNDSRNLKYILEKISEIKELKYEECEQFSYENAVRLFGIK